MFDKFGEFDSYIAINEAAKNQLAEGDKEAVREIAKENGLDPDDTEDFISGDIDFLCKPLSAALGKLSVEKDDLKGCGNKLLYHDWFGYIEGCCAEDSDFALAVRKKGKRLYECLGAILRESNEIMETVDSRIITASGMRKGKGQVGFGIPREARVREIIKDYYLGGDEHDT